MKKHVIVTTLLSTLLLSSCTTQMPIIGSKIYIVLDMHQRRGISPYWHVVKNLPYADWQCNGYHRYFIFGGHCYMRPRDYVPDTITIEYARWLTMQENKDRGFSARAESSEAVESAAHARRDAAIDQLPPSAWRKITIKPKQLIAKYQHRMPAGHPEGYLFPDSRTREIWIQMDMQADGTVKISERYKWRYGPGGISNWR
jgi:hypothetical protein